jgi:hypothetical protein
MFGLYKIEKPNLAEKASFKNLPDLTGGVYFYGRIGSGKTVSMMSFAQKYHDDPRKEYKIFDLWGGERNEHLYWCFPSQDKKYWQSVKKLLTLNEDGPKQYKVHLLYPYWKATTPITLPFDTPNIRSSVFTIPIHSIVNEDLFLALGLISENDKFLWREATEKIKKNEGSRMFLHISQKIAKINQTLFKNFIVPVAKNMIIQSDSSSFNFDIVEEMKDRETISILCLEFIPKEYRLFVLGWVIRQMATKLDEGKIKAKNILLMREAAEFFRATDDSLLPPSYKMFRIQLSNFLRMGRRGMNFFLDAQSPRETRGLVDGQQDLTLLCKLPAESDREDATAQLYRDNLITKRQIQQLAVLDPGQAMFIETGKKAKLRYILLPRTMYWKPGYGNFYENTYKNFNGNFKNFTEILMEVNQKWDEEEKHLEEMKIIEELKKKEGQEKEQKEKLEEQHLELEKEQARQKTIEMRQQLMERKTQLEIEKEQAKEERALERVGVKKRVRKPRLEVEDDEDEEDNDENEEDDKVEFEPQPKSELGYNQQVDFVDGALLEVINSIK